MVKLTNCVCFVGMYVVTNVTLKLNGYRMEQCCANNRRTGGVMVYTKDYINYTGCLQKYVKILRACSTRQNNTKDLYTEYFILSFQYIEKLIES